MAREYDSDISYEIKAMVGTIGTKKNGWRKELNIVSWNGAPPKFDIRDWSPDHMHMSKGVTLYMDEIRQLVRIFNNFSNDRRTRNPRNEMNLRAADEAFEEVPDRPAPDPAAPGRTASDQAMPNRRAQENSVPPVNDRWETEATAPDAGTGSDSGGEECGELPEGEAGGETPESDYSSSGISHVAEAGPAEEEGELPF